MDAAISSETSSYVSIHKEIAQQFPTRRATDRQQHRKLEAVSTMERTPDDEH
jgi:hypothetical protein